jgi:peroxiredoxin
VLAASLATGYLFRDSLDEAADAWITRNMFVAAEAATFQPGPEIGTRLPDLQAHHEGRSITRIEEFSRGNGIVLIALRSVDWCAYCKRQIIDLQEYKSYFDVFGIGLVAITNDHPEAQQPFIERHAITIPVLSDAQSVSFKSLGILNTNFQPGDSEYGLPHPGAIIVNRDGVITGKLFVEKHNLRVFSSEILDYPKQSLGLKGLF